MTVNFEGVDFNQFQQLREKWLAQNPQAIDAGDTNVYKWANFFEPAADQFVEKAQYRCHLAEEYLLWLGQQSIGKSNILVSSGVRHSLGLLVGQAGHWIRPSDVYPEYARIQDRMAASGTTYCSRLGLPWEQLERAHDWNLLVCDPLKPWGGDLQASQWARLIETAKHKNGQVWIDGAYALAPHPLVVEAINNGHGVAWLGSLSKGWLSPWTMGVVLGSDQIIAPWRKVFQGQEKQPDKLQLAWKLLTKHGDMPQRVAQLCDLGRERMIQLLARKGILSGLLNPGQGYFLRHAMPVEELAKHGVLAIPSSVFCDRTDQDKRSVLSVVSQISAEDLLG